MNQKCLRGNIKAMRVYRINVKNRAIFFGDNREQAAVIHVHVISDKSKRPVSPNKYHYNGRDDAKPYRRGE